MVLDRRTFLRSGLVAGGGAAVLGSLESAASATPALLRARPRLTHGVQSGDVTAEHALVWARADRPSRMLVDVSARPDFRGSYTVRGPLLTPETDLTGKTWLCHLPSNDEIHYRVRLADPDGRTESEPVAGRFRTPSNGPRDVRFVWAGDLAGQGWGINPGFGGYKIFNAMAAADPDFFLCSGDWIYADGALVESVALPDGTTWHNLVTAEKSKVAETLAEYRGQFRYNLLDGPLRAFNAQVPMIYQWDDHEVRNNWYPGQILDDTRYTEKRVDVLASRARRAAFEYTPISILPPKDGKIYRKISHGPLLDVFVLDMRTYKDPNGPDNTPGAKVGLLGAEQTAWLKRELRRSTATWKVISNDLPLGLVVPDGAVNQEAVAQGDDGAPLGREGEFAGILSYAKQHAVTNLVFVTADVHYTAAHYYDPVKASYTDFDPFWEFVAGPLNAGTFGPNTLDGTFGPQLKFIKTGPRANASPAEGAQFFGDVAIDGHTGVLTVKLRDLDNIVLYSVDLHPRR
ncbi:MAG: alkaline phosphatase [Streptosporangiaceae bacterium]|jgi:alkaline phosphatase D|nr:Tat (twin-arginine translocation) pathway signal sequence domain protein [Streptosporangiaceae bacterium]MDX6429271.1 alkaline phosphatase [Streptosporangiaceae bacterium]